MTAVGRFLSGPRKDPVDLDDRSRPTLASRPPAAPVGSALATAGPVWGQKMTLERSRARRRRGTFEPGRRPAEYAADRPTG